MKTPVCTAVVATDNHLHPDASTKRARFKVLVPILCTMFISVETVTAQPYISEISLSFSSNRTHQVEFTSLPTYAVYPQLEISSVLTSMNNSKSYLGLSLNIGGWNDGVEDAAPNSNNETISYSEVIAGGRIRVGVLNKAMPAFIWFGYSRHFLESETIRFAHHRRGPVIDSPYNSLEIGIRIQLPVSSRILLGLEAQRSFRSWEDGPGVPESVIMIYGLVTSFRIRK